MVKVCLPGTGGMMPLENRWLACCWIEHEGSALLIDCGEGTQIALKQAKCKISKLSTLLITHFHADHISGLPGLLLTLGNYGKTSPLKIIGPCGLQEVVKSLCVIAPELPYSLEIIALPEGKRTLEYNNMKISVLSLSHGMPCLGYRIDFLRKPVFDPQKAEILNIPKTLYKKLHAGQSIVLENGQVITPEMVLDGMRKPLSICYCTDTHPVQQIPAFARQADLFVCEGMYGDAQSHPKLEEKGHMLFSDSANIAKSAQVKRLWITHHSPAVQNPQEYISDVKAIFEHVNIAYDGICTMLYGEA